MIAFDELNISDELKSRLLNIGNYNIACFSGDLLQGKSTALFALAAHFYDQYGYKLYYVDFTNWMKGDERFDFICDVEILIKNRSIIEFIDLKKTENSVVIFGHAESLDILAETKRLLGLGIKVFFCKTASTINGPQQMIADLLAKKAPISMPKLKRSESHLEKRQLPPGSKAVFVHRSKNEKGWSEQSMFVELDKWLPLLTETS